MTLEEKNKEISSSITTSTSSGHNLSRRIIGQIQSPSIFSSVHAVTRVCEVGPIDAIQIRTPPTCGCREVRRPSRRPGIQSLCLLVSLGKWKRSLLQIQLVWPPHQSSNILPLQPSRLQTARRKAGSQIDPRCCKYDRLWCTRFFDEISTRRGHNIAAIAEIPRVIR